MINCFDSDVAQNVGVIAAVIYKNIQYWCEHNRANRKNEHDGYFWTFNSVEAFCEMFSYLTKNQIILALKKLEESGYIKSGNYNKSAYDRTKWYTDIKGGFGELSDDISIYDKTEMETQENKNGFIGNAKPIPNNNTNNNQITTDKKNTKKNFDAILDSVDVIRDNPDLKAAFISFLEMRESIKHPVKTEDGMKRLINEAYKCGNGDPAQMVACINKSIIGSYRGIFPVHEEKGMAIHSKPQTRHNGPKSAMDILDEMMAEELAKEANNA